MKGNCVKARTEMLPRSSRQRRKDWGCLEGGGPSAGSVFSAWLSFGYQQREGTGPLMRGQHLPWRQGVGKERERWKEDRKGGGQDTIDATQRGRLPCVYVCVHLNFCWKITCIQKRHSHGHQWWGKTENCHRLEETKDIGQLKAVWSPRLDPGREKGR